MKQIIQIILRIVKHPGVLRLLLKILETVDAILQDNDDNNK